MRFRFIKLCPRIGESITTSLETLPQWRAQTSDAFSRPLMVAEVKTRINFRRGWPIYLVRYIRYHPFVSCGFSSFEYCVMMVDTDAEDVFADGSCCDEPRTVRKNIFPAATNMYVKLPHLAAMLIKGWNKNIMQAVEEKKISITWARNFLYLNEFF